MSPSKCTLAPLLFALTACNPACTAPAADAPEGQVAGGAQPIAQEPAGDDAQEPAEQAEASGPTAPPGETINTAKGVDLSGLDENKKTVFFQLLNTEMSACGKPESLAKSLRDYEYQVEAARDPFQAGYLLGKFAPNVVLVELEIGADMTGASVCRSVRSLPKLRDTAVVGISSDKDQAKIDALLDAGADDFVSKPFDVETLVERIVNLIGPVVIGTSGRATTGKISGKLTKRVAEKTDEEEDDKMTRKAPPKNPHRTTHGGVLAGPDDDEDFGT